MAATLTAARPEKVVLITDVFQNISQVPVAVENHLDTSSETTDSLYSDVQHPSLVPYDYATEDYSDYFYDDFTNYTSSQYNDDYNELNQTVLSRRDEVWNDFNITTGQLNHSDLYIFDGRRWDPRLNFLEGVVGNLFLVPLAFIVGLCIGVILWGIFVFLRKLLISLVKWLRTTSLLYIVDDICCVKIFHHEPKRDRKNTIWYEDRLEKVNCEKETSITYSQKLSEIKSNTNCCEDDKNSKLHSHDEANIDENNNRDTKAHFNGRKVSNSTFFLTNGMYNEVESHQISGKYKSKMFKMGL